MGEAVMDKSQLDQIGQYVKNHISQWMKEENIFPFPQQSTGIDKELLERMVTVEQQLKFQNEKLELMMQQSDKRFTDLQINLDKRFESMDRRFSDLRDDMNLRFNASEKHFSRQYVFLSGIFLTLLAGFIPLVINSL